LYGEEEGVDTYLPDT